MVALLCGGFKVICAVVLIVVRTVLIKQNTRETVLGILVAKLRLLPQVVIFLFCPSVRFGQFVIGQIAFLPFIPEKASYLIRRQITVLKIAEPPMVDAIAVMIHRFIPVSRSLNSLMRLVSFKSRPEINCSRILPSCSSSSLF